MARVVHAVDVEIKGEFDPSLAKAVGMTEAELKRLQSAAKTFNSLMSKMVMPREAVNATNQINTALGRMESRSEQATRRMRENFEKIGEAGKKAAEKIQGSLAHAFDSIVEHGMRLTGIGGLLGAIGGAFAGEEFVRGAFETRARTRGLAEPVAKRDRSRWLWVHGTANRYFVAQHGRSGNAGAIQATARNQQPFTKRRTRAVQGRRVNA
jgi:hypothetical protein